MSNPVGLVETASRDAARAAKPVAPAPGAGEIVAPEPSKKPAPPRERLVSLDAYRGLAMVLMASSGLGLARVAKHFPDSTIWQAVKYHVEHVPWEGCALWDLIQPSFMFMVGVAAAYSYASRIAAGQSRPAQARHALVRAVILSLLGIFLNSQRTPSTNFIFTDVLTQIGLGYFFLFLLCGQSTRAQWSVAAALLAIDWLLFAAWPAPGPDFNFAAVGVPADWPHPTGFAAHWDKNSNIGAAVDVWFMNLFPRPERFVFNPGGYLTLNFIPSLSTMIFGLLAGGLLREARPPMQKFWRLAGFGLAGIVVGYLWSLSGTCPLVKRIWTPSWTLFAGGITSLTLAAFYVVVDIWGWRRWTLPLVVVGMNSILMYVMAKLLPGWISQTAKIHFGSRVFHPFGEDYVPLVESSVTLAVMWLTCYWLYRQKIFIRV